MTSWVVSWGDAILDDHPSGRDEGAVVGLGQRGARGVGGTQDCGAAPDGGRPATGVDHVGAGADPNEPAVPPREFRREGKKVRVPGDPGTEVDLYDNKQV